jgi:hypothetical protein
MFSRRHCPDRSVSPDECDEKVLSGRNYTEAEFGDSGYEEGARDKRNGPEVVKRKQLGGMVVQIEIPPTRIR